MAWSRFTWLENLTQAVAARFNNQEEGIEEDKTAAAAAQTTANSAKTLAESKVTKGEAETIAGEAVNSPVNIQAGAYTLVLVDAHKTVELNSATAAAFTIPPHSSVALPVGVIIECTQANAGQLQILAGAGVTLQLTPEAEAKTREAWSRIKLYQRATNEWELSGSLATIVSPGITWPAGVAYGLNGGGELSSGDASVAVAAKVKWGRTEPGSEEPTPKQVSEKGLKCLCIAGNTPRAVKLSKYASTSGTEPGIAKWVYEAMKQIEENAAYSPVFECGNEMYLVKEGGGYADAVSYGTMFLALANEMYSKGYTQPLLFSMTGDYEKSSGKFSPVVGGEGWLADALAGNTSAPVYAAQGSAPGSPSKPRFKSLKEALLSHGFAMHPYNENGTGENHLPGLPVSETAGFNGGSYHVMNMAGEGRPGQKAMSGSILTLLGTVPPCYMTEFGVLDAKNTENKTDYGNQLKGCIAGGSYKPSGEATGAEVTGITGWHSVPYVRGIFPYSAYDKYHEEGAKGWGMVRSESGGTEWPSWKVFRELAEAYGT